MLRQVPSSASRNALMPGNHSRKGVSGVAYRNASFLTLMLYPAICRQNQLLTQPLRLPRSVQRFAWLQQGLTVCLFAATAQGIPLSPHRAIAATFPEAIANAQPALIQAPIAQTTEAQTAARPTLRPGSTGDSVEEVQALLTLLGYFSNAVDGQYQDTTESAVRAFQQDLGLSSDGIVGPATWDKLLPAPSTNLTPPEVAEVAASPTPSQSEEKDESVGLPTLKPGMRGPAVVQVQETLEALGFYDGAIDGIFGPGTEAAVKAFQSRTGLVDDGVVGPATWGALLRRQSS